MQFFKMCSLWFGILMHESIGQAKWKNLKYYVVYMDKLT